MKKFLFLLSVSALLALSTQHVQAQTDFKSATYNKVLDTVVNTGTYYEVSPRLANLNGDSYAIQLNATNIAGTTTITAVLQSSIDGVSYSNHFKTPGQTGVNCDTLAISGTTSHIYNVRAGVQTSYGGAQFNSNSGRRMYFRVKLVGGATGTTKINTIVIPQ